MNPCTCQFPSLLSKVRVEVGVVPLGLASVALNRIWTLRAHVSLLQALEANLVAFHKSILFFIGLFSKGSTLQGGVGTILAAQTKHATGSISLVRWWWSRCPSR